MSPIIENRTKFLTNQSTNKYHPHLLAIFPEGLNGSHSPQSATAMNGGRTPSPPTLGSLMNSTSGQQLPPACGARQLSKLKRFLTTLQQFGSDISPEIGERVRTLVLGLVVSLVTAIVFHRFGYSNSFL